MFKEDLTKGQEYERKFAQYLADEKGYTTFSFSDDERWDILAVRETPDGRRADTFEVKADFYEDTPNLAIELMCLHRGKLTGIWASQAKYFVYMFQHGKWYVFETVDIRKYIAENDVKIVRGGDNKYSVIALLTKKEAELIVKKII